MVLDLALSDSEDDDYEDDKGYFFKFEECSLNEGFQSSLITPLVAQRGEANKRIERIPELTGGVWEQVKEYITHTTGELREGFSHIPNGEAGGIKIMGNRVFLKICCQKTASDPEFYEDYSHAAKVAGHDLKGLNAILSCCQANGLHVPYTCIVDYKGYRTLVATAVPITEKTQINTKKYTGEHLDEFIARQNRKKEKAQKNLAEAKAANNTQDVAKYEKEIPALEEVIKKEPGRRKAMKSEVERVISDLAQKLNLRPHKITDQGEEKESPLPFDLEIHEGYDGRIYGLDFARLMPPERPAHKGKREYLYRLMRMELVRKGAALSSDAFFGGDDNPEIFAAELSATEALQKKIIPEAANSFLESDENDAATLKKFMHRHGINLRYLGRFLFFLKQRNDVVAKKLPAEMVARAYTHILNKKMREKIQDMIIKSKCADVLNHISNWREGEFPKELQEQLRTMYLTHLPHNDFFETDSLFDDSGATAKYWSNIVRANSIMIRDRITEMTGIKMKRSEGKDIVTFDHVMKKITFPPTPIVHLTNGDYPSAKIYYKAELNLKISILGPRHLRVAIALIYLAEVYAEPNSEKDNILAEQYFDQAIDIYKDAYEAGKNVKLDYAAALERKAKFLFRCRGMKDRARIDKLLGDALQIKQIGGSQLEIARSLNFQAWVDYHAEQYSAAIEKYTKSIQILRSTFCELSTLSKKFHPNLRDFAMAHSNLALVVHKNGKPEKALQLCEKARLLLKKKYKNNLDRITLAGILDTIGEIRDSLDAASAQTKEEPAAPVKGDSKASTKAPPMSEHRSIAKKYFERALRFRKEACGEQHYLYGMSLDHVAQMHLKNGEFDDAFAKYDKALSILKQSLGKHHSSVGILLHNIALWFAHQKNFERALDAEIAAYNVLSSSFWQQHKLAKNSRAALEIYNKIDVEGGLPPPLSHEGVLAPDQPDPACFWGVYQSENQITMSEEQRRQFDTFVDLLTEIRAQDHDLNQELINELHSFLESIIPTLASMNNESQESSDKKKSLFSRSWTLEVEEKGDENDPHSFKRRASVSAPDVEARIASGKSAFEFRIGDSKSLSFQPAKHISSTGMGRDPGSMLQLLPPSLDPPPAIGKGKDAVSTSVTTSTQEQSITNILERTYLSDLNTLVSKSEAAQILDPLIRQLAPSEKRAFRQITRDLIYNNRLIAAASRLPFANTID